MASKREDFNALFTAHFFDIVRYVERRGGNTALAEDIAEDTFELAWSVMDRQEITLPWLYTTAGFKLKEHARRARRGRAVQDALERRFEESPPTVDTIEGLALGQALAVLTPRERAIVQLTYWEGLTADELAQALQCRAATVWMTLSRARKKMARELSPMLAEEVSGVRRP